MNKGKMVSAAALGLLIAGWVVGCASSGRVSGEGATAATATAFSIRRGSEDPAVLQRIAQAKLMFQSRPTGVQQYRDIERLLAQDLKTSPAAAEFYIVNQIGEGARGRPLGVPIGADGYSLYHANRGKALETLISHRYGVRYLEDYWLAVESDPPPPFYSERFIVAASSAYAEEEPDTPMGAYGQKRLMTYWSQGCNARTWKMDNDVNIVNMALNPIVGQKCKPDMAKVGYYFAKYLSAGMAGVSPQRVGSAVALASHQANMYMRTNNYPRAAGWYAVVVRLGTANPGTYSTELAARNADDLFRRLYRPGLRWAVNGDTLTVGDITAGSVRQAQALAHSQVREAITQLATIQAAGYNVIEVY